MASGHASTTYSSTFTGTVADRVTLDQLWALIQVTNHDPINTLWIRQDGTTTPADAVASGVGCTSVLPLQSVAIAGMPTSFNTLVVSVVGNGGGYTVAGANAVSSSTLTSFVVLPVVGGPNLFVDSVNGNDSNDGLAAGSPKLTIAAAIATLPSTGGTICGFGTFIETVTLPTFPKIVNLRPLGSRRNFIIQAPAINTPSIQCAGAAVQFGTIECCVQPHASGTTGGLVLMDGMRHMRLDIDYLDNGTGGCGRIFDARSVVACYRNTIVPTCIAQAHASRVVFCGNNGTAGTNANICRIETPFIYANSNMVTVFDLGDSTDWTIDGGLVESNTGAVFLIPGNSTTVFKTWDESNALASIVPAAAGARTVNAHNVSLIDTYHSTATLTIPTGLVGWHIRYGGTLTVTDTDGWAHNRMDKDGVQTGTLRANMPSAGGTPFAISVAGVDYLATGFPGSNGIDFNNTLGKIRFFAAGTAPTVEYRSSAGYDAALMLLNGVLAGGSAATGSIYGGSGAPNNANGANGDIYLRTDGGALTTIYQRRAGAWVGIV